MRLILLSVFLLAPGACKSADGPDRAIVFRQHELEHLWNAPPQAYLDARFSEVEEVRRALFTALPRVCRVYMTEGYYYFRASLADRDISGNFRLRYSGDGAPPLLNFAYFDADNPRTFRTKPLRDGDPDVSIRPLSPGCVEVRFEGMTRTFIDETAGARLHDPGIALGDRERFVSGVVDESGVRFELVFNTETSYFYYLLADRPRHGDEWTVIGEIGPYRVLLGQRSKFVLLDCPDDHRLLLIGVSAAQVRRNTYYDGPFDQVPPDLDIGNDLSAAYPYVTYGSGIDTHGNFIDRDDVRVAISPYQTYEDLEAFVEQIRRVVASDPAFTRVYQQLCYESKRDFDPDTATGHAPRRNWPANHFATVSYSWEKSGRREDSDIQRENELRTDP